MIFAGDLIRERARVTPDKIALVYVETGERLSYGELDRRVDGAAQAILSAGLLPGERFGLLASNSVDFIALFFGSGRAGTIIVPLSTRATAYELNAILRDAGARVVFESDEFAALDLHVTNRLPVGACREETPRATGGTAPETAADSEAVYCLLYTSGTTGQPKGVMIPRRQLYWNGYNTAMNWGLRDDDVSPVFTPLYHAGGLAAFMIPTFCAGGTIVLHKTFDVHAVWRTIVEERCTVVLGVPTIWRLLMEAPEFATADLQHARWFISGGAPLPQFIIEAWQQRGVVFKQGYGMTEVGVNCFTMTVQESFAKRGSIGRPMMFTSVRLVDFEGNDVAVGDVGEMWIRGPHLSLGYWRNEEATQEAYGADGWFHTGDLARRDEDGFFTIAGRRKEMFISGGVNVYPAEIESELLAHPAVRDAAVVPVHDEVWGEAGVAFVVGGDYDARALTEWLLSRLSKYKIPRRFIFVDALPRSPYGKVEKEKLRAALEGGQ